MQWSLLVMSRCVVVGRCIEMEYGRHISCGCGCGCGSWTLSLSEYKSRQEGRGMRETVVEERRERARKRKRSKRRWITIATALYPYTDLTPYNLRLSLAGPSTFDSSSRACNATPCPGQSTGVQGKVGNVMMQGATRTDLARTLSTAPIIRTTSIEVAILPHPMHNSKFKCVRHAMRDSRVRARTTTHEVRLG